MIEVIILIIIIIITTIVILIFSCSRFMYIGFYTNKNFGVPGGKTVTFSALPNRTSFARFDGRHYRYLSCKVSINNSAITSFSVDIVFARVAKFK